MSFGLLLCSCNRDIPQRSLYAVRPDPFGSGFGKNGIHGPGTVKADGAGNIAFTLSFDANACRGEYAVSARALGSKAGAFVVIELSGNAVVQNATVWVTPKSISALQPKLTVYGSGFPAGAHVNCWFTPPDGRVTAQHDEDLDHVWTASVGNDGTFILQVIAGNSTYANGVPPFGLVSAEEPGTWSVTCATPNHSTLGTASFLIFSLVADP